MDSFGLEVFMRATIFTAITLGGAALLSGCASENAKTDAPAKDRTENPAAKQETMSGFFIGSTDFGVESSRSRFDITKGEGDRMFVTVELRGNEATARKLMENEKSDWSWIQAGPYFYLRKY